MEDDAKTHGSISEFDEDSRDKNEKHLKGDKSIEDESLNELTVRGDDTNLNESDEEKQQKQEVATRILEHDSDKEEIGKLDHADRDSHGEAEYTVEDPVIMDRGEELTQEELDMAEQTENMAEQELLDPDEDLRNYQKLLDVVLLETEAREEEAGEGEEGYEGGDEANGAENKADEIARDEEEFADTEDQELKQVTEGDENLHEGESLKIEEELLEEHGENLEQEYDYEREQENDNMETRSVSASKRMFGKDDQPPQMSPVVSASPHSYRSGESGRHTAVDYRDEQNEEDEEEKEEEMEHHESRISREELVERYHQALTERHQLQEHNYQLQHKLSEYFRRKRSDDSRLEDRNVADQEQRYLKNMAVLDDLRQEERKRNVIFRAELDELKQRCAEKQELVDQERLQLMERKKEVALVAINSHTGKTIPPKDVEQYLNAESRKEAEVVAVRLENIKLKNRLRKEEVALKSKEELAEGLHLIDFEQLKIENQTYNEKIEERNEELLKLRRKITSTVQVLTHLKEKLQFVQNENQTEKAQLRGVEELVGKRRDTLSRLKQARDALRFDNQNIHQNGGLLGNRPLLCDFEDRKDETDDLSQKLSQLKMRHAELTLNLNAVRKKIEASKER